MSALQSVSLNRPNCLEIAPEADAYSSADRQYFCRSHVPVITLLYALTLAASYSPAWLDRTALPAVSL